MAEAGIHVIAYPAEIGAMLARVIGKAPFFHCGQSSKGLPSWWNSVCCEPFLSL